MKPNFQFWSRGFLIPCLLIAGIKLASALQTLPPANPYMGPQGTSTMHANAASSDATSNSGPGSGAVSIINESFDAVFSTILMGSDGMLLCVATKWDDQTPYVYLVDPVTLASLASMKLVKSTISSLAGGIYSYVDAQGRLVLVNAAGDLQRISHSQSTNGTWQLTVNDSVNIGYPDVVGLVPDYSGRVWFATFEGTNSNSGAVVGYYDTNSSNIYSYTLPSGEGIANSISSSPQGVAVASTAALYLFTAGANGPEQVWRQTYSNSLSRKPGQLSCGTGSTPSFFGPYTGYEYLTITDNASPQEHIVVYHSATGNQLGSVPFLTSGKNSGTEDAGIAVGRSIFVPSTYGYQYPPSAASGQSIPASAPFVGGLQRVDVLPDGSGLTNVWMNQTLPSAAVPCLSLVDHLIYTVVVNTNTGMYSYATVNPDTGAIVGYSNIGTSASNNTLQMIGTISPSGVLYQGTERGLLSVTSAVPALGSFLVPTKVWGDGSFALIAPISTSSGSWSYRCANTNVIGIKGNTVTIKGAGTAIITATQAAYGKYVGASTTATFSVSKAPPTLGTFTIPAKTYGAAPFALVSPSSTCSGSWSFNSGNSNVATVKGATLTIKGVGTAVVTASQAPGRNFTGASATASLVVAKGTQTINFSLPPTVPFRNNGSIPLKGTDSVGLPITYNCANTNIMTIVGANAVMKGRGTNTIIASQPGNGNYNAATSVQRTIIVK